MIKDYRIYDKLSDAMFIIDLKSSCVVYFNPICSSWFPIHLNMNIQELIDELRIENDVRTSYEVVSEQLKMHQEYTIEHIRTHCLSAGIVDANISLGYVDDTKTQVYFIIAHDAKNLEQAYMRNKYFDIIYSMSFSYPFRLEIATRRIYFIGPIMEHFQLPPMMENYPQDLLESGFLHEDDYDAFMDIVDSMYQGKMSDQVFRCYTQDGSVLWYKANYVVHTNEANQPVEVIGEFISVQEQKELEQKVKIDELTGCLNKSVFQQYVENVVNVSSKDDVHALIMMDVDNFKMINDNLGHQFGDFVLKEVGFDLNNLVRSYDLVGRVGGDEFMIFLKNVKYDKVIKAVCGRILDAIDKSYESKKVTYCTTASIGIAKYPMDGMSFDHLYNHADTALYYTKRSGKNSFTFYDDSMSSCNMKSEEIMEEKSQVVPKQYDESVIYDLTVLMFESEEYDLTINQAISYLGRRFHASRCYVIYQAADGSIEMSYEWCRDGIESKFSEEARFSKNHMNQLIEAHYKAEIIHIPDLSVLELDLREVVERQGVKSFLMVGIKGKQGSNYFFGVDDCNAKRRWTNKEIGTLYSTSRLVGQTLKYKESLKLLNEIEG